MSSSAPDSGPSSHPSTPSGNNRHGSSSSNNNSSRQYQQNHIADISPTAHSVHVDIAGNTSLHRAIYSIARQTRAPAIPSSPSESTRAPEQTAPTPKQIIKQLLATTDGFHATKVQDRRGGWTPLHLCCRLVDVPDDVTIALAECDPSAIAYSDDEGENCLHLACRYGLSERVVGRLVELSPRYAFLAKDDAEGDTVLHTAINHNATPNILKMLVEANPQSLREDNHDSQTPLQLAANHERFDFIECAVKTMVRETSASDCMEFVSKQDIYCSTPITTLWTSYVESFGGSVEDGYCSWIDTHAESEEQRDTWMSLCHMVMSAFSGAVVGDSNDHHLLLRSVISMGADAIPASLLKYVVLQYPSTLLTRNDDGALPLHEAIMAFRRKEKLVKTTRAHIFNHLEDELESEAKGDEDSKMLLTSKEESKECEENGNHSSSDDSSDTIEDIIKGMTPSPLHILIDACPRASSLPDGNGRLPLHLAIEQCIAWDEGLQMIFDAAPESLRIADPKTAFVPFMSAAIFSRGNEEADEINACNTVFELLRLGPDLISSGTSTSVIDNNDEKRSGKRGREESSMNNLDPLCSMKKAK